MKDKNLDAHKVGTIIKVSDELLADSAFDLENYLYSEFIRRIGDKEEDIVWSEGTLGYVLLALILGNETEAYTYMDECIKLQNVPNGSGGVLYVTGTYASLPWEFHVWESVVSSAWLYLLIKNPSVLFPRTLRQVYYMARITNINDERP